MGQRQTTPSDPDSRSHHLCGWPRSPLTDQSPTDSTECREPVLSRGSAQSKPPRSIRCNSPITYRLLPHPLVRVSLDTWILPSERHGDTPRLARQADDSSVTPAAQQSLERGDLVKPVPLRDSFAVWKVTKLCRSHEWHESLVLCGSKLGNFARRGSPNVCIRS